MAEATLTMRSAITAVIAALLLSACSTTPPRLTSPAPPPPQISLVEPKPPAGASINLVVPPRDAFGRYHTINFGISQAAMIWHLRSALNVAALGCRGPLEATLTSDYNRLLAEKRALLASALAQTEADARAVGGKDWRDTHDRQMTRLYNYFALPPVKSAFCTVAVRVAAEAVAVSSAEFQAFADSALPRLEAPFLDFYMRYDRYRLELAEWRARTMPATNPVEASVSAMTPPADKSIAAGEASYRH